MPDTAVNKQRSSSSRANLNLPNMFPPCDSRLVWFQHFHFIGSLAERTNDDIAVFRLNKDLAKDVNRDVSDEERVVVIGAGGMETRYCSAFWTRHAKGSPEKIVAP